MTNSPRLKILFFSAWYPHRYDAMAGLFVRKHALAVSRFADVCVLFPYADENVSEFEIVEQETDGVKEIFIYYPFCKKKILKKFSKIINYWRSFKIGYKIILQQFGKPNITQTNVLTRAGVFSFYLKKTQKIPFVIVEHWTRYLPSNLSYSGFIRKLTTQTIVKHASCVMTVSQSLYSAMENNGLHNKKHCTINNVVDDFFYIPQVKLFRTKKRILHVSCFSERAKNVKGLLNSVDKLRQLRNDFELIIIGTGEDFNDVQNYAHKLKLEGFVVFLGEKQPEEVCQNFYQSDFFVLFSNYENAPVVISESLACGKPVITTDVGFAQSIITEQNGRIIPVGNEAALTKEMNWMLDNYSQFSAETIRESTKQFSFDAVGKKLLDIYEQI